MKNLEDLQCYLLYETEAEKIIYNKIYIVSIAEIFKQLQTADRIGQGILWNWIDDKFFKGKSLV